MADLRFFTRKGPFTIADIVKFSGVDVSDDKLHVTIQDVATLEGANENHVTFFTNVKYRDLLKNTKAAACFVDRKHADQLSQDTVALISDNPYKAYAVTAQAFYPEPTLSGNISKSAHIDNTAQIGDGCTIGPGAVIGANARIGSGTVIGPNTVIGNSVDIGRYCVINANVTVTYAVIGNYVRLYSGVRIGQDGFGFAIDPSGFIRVPQLGRVIIGDFVEIGANTTIDRGAGPDTEIGAGTWIDNLVQVAHNVKIGKGCVIAAQTGIAGSTILEDYVMAGGQAGFAGHTTVGKGAKVGAQSGVMRDIPPGVEVLGSPAIPLKERMKHLALLNRLIKKGKKG